MLDDPEAGSAFLASATDTDLNRLFDNVDSFETQMSLARQVDAGRVDSGDIEQIGKLLDNGKMDGADLRRFSELLDRRDSDPLIGTAAQGDSTRIRAIGRLRW